MFKKFINFQFLLWSILEIQKLQTNINKSELLLFFHKSQKHFNAEKHLKKNDQIIATPPIVYISKCFAGKKKTVSENSASIFGNVHVCNGFGWSLLKEFQPSLSVYFYIIFIMFRFAHIWSEYRMHSIPYCILLYSIAFFFLAHTKKGHRTKEKKV